MKSLESLTDFEFVGRALETAYGDTANTGLALHCLNLLAAGCSRGAVLHKVCRLGEKELKLRGAEWINSEDLRRLPDEPMIREAYRRILKREVDREGLRNWQRKMRRGMSKEEVILHIGRSAEARKHPIVVDLEIDPLESKETSRSLLAMCRAAIKKVIRR